MDNNTNQSHLDSVENQVERYKQVLDVMPAGLFCSTRMVLCEKQTPRRTEF